MPLSEVAHRDGPLGVTGLMSADILVRLVDISGRGCLLESSRSIAEGTTGSLRMEFGGVTLQEDLRVARCQQLDRAGTVYRIGAQFLQTEGPDVTSLRHAVSVMGSEKNDSIFVEQILPERLPALIRSRPGNAVTSKGAKS